LVPLAGTEWRAILDRLQRSVKLPVRLEAGLEVQVGMSIGVALSKGRVQPEVLLAEADEAMLIAKRAGKGHIHLATTST
jgi:GGDEF domain-containing protein